MVMQHVSAKFSKKDGDMSDQPNGVNHFINLGGIFTYLFVLGVAMLGGLVRFIRHLNNSREPMPLGKLACKLVGELSIAAFAGLLTFWLCLAWGVGAAMTAVFVGVSGHLGGQAIDGISSIYSAWIEFRKGQQQ